jgi:hypothetical protein
MERWAQFEKAAAIEWQVKAEESATLAMETLGDIYRNIHAEMGRYRYENARYWMGIDDDIDQLCA